MVDAQELSADDIFQNEGACKFMDGKGKDNQQDRSSSWHCDYSCCGEKNSPSTVLDGL